MQMLSGAKAFFNEPSRGVEATPQDPYLLAVSSLAEDEELRFVSDYAGYPDLIEAHLQDLARQRERAAQSGVVALRKVIDRAA